MGCLGGRTVDDDLRHPITVGHSDQQRECRAGDQVVVTANDRRRGLLKGTRSTVTGVDARWDTLTLAAGQHQLTVPAGRASGDSTTATPPPATGPRRHRRCRRALRRRHPRQGSQLHRAVLRPPPHQPPLQPGGQPCRRGGQRRVPRPARGRSEHQSRTHHGHAPAPHPVEHPTEARQIGGMSL